MLKLTLGAFVLSTFVENTVALATGPHAYATCLVLCWSGCKFTGTAAGAVAGGPAGAVAGAAASALACIKACGVVCAPFIACLSSNTSITVYDNGKSIKKSIIDINSGDLVETIKDNKVLYTEVAHNTKVTGSFSFVTIRAQDIYNASNTKYLEITDEHVLAIYHDNMPMTIKKASNVQIGDVLLDNNMNKLQVENLHQHTLEEKYVLITKQGTVLANDIYVTTFCDGVITGDDQLLGATIKDWQNQHSFSDHYLN